MREPSVLMLGSPNSRLRNKDLGARIWKAIPRNMEEEQAKEIRKGRKSTECLGARRLGHVPTNSIPPFCD